MDTNKKKIQLPWGKKQKFVLPNFQDLDDELKRQSRLYSNGFDMEVKTVLASFITEYLQQVYDVVVITVGTYDNTTILAIYKDQTSAEKRESER